MFCVMCPEFWKFSGKKVKILEFTSKEAATPLIAVAATVWFWKFLRKIDSFFGNFESLGKFWKFRKIANYNFQSRGQIMTLTGVFYYYLLRAKHLGKYAHYHFLDSLKVFNQWFTKNIFDSGQYVCVHLWPESHNSYRSTPQLSGRPQTTRFCQRSLTL